MNTLKKTLVAIFLSPTLTAVAASDGILFGVNVGTAQDSGIYARKADLYASLQQSLENAIGTKVRVQLSEGSEREMRKTRTGYYGIIMAPAHMIASATKYGYIPIAKMQGDTSVQFITLDPAITDLGKAQGKRLVIPKEGSLAHYVAMGELSKKRLDADKYFSSVMKTSYDDAAIYSLTSGFADVAAVEASVAKKLAASNNKLRVIASSKPIPGISIAIADSMPEAMRNKIGMSAATLTPENNETLRILNARFEAASPDDFKEIGHIANYTPISLAGANIINSTQAREMLAKGTKLYDTRVTHEYQEGHISKAISLPYKEKSKKSADFDPKEDEFDVKALPANKAEGVIFACNGPECWKSYKASKVALNNGYSKVYWFRGGLPEWKASNFPVER